VPGQERERFDPLTSPPPGAQIYAWARALRAPSYRYARTTGLLSRGLRAVSGALAAVRGGVSGGAPPRGRG